MKRLIVVLFALLASTVPATPVQAEAWDVFIDSRYLPEGEQKRKHPKTHVEEVRIPRDAPLGVGICTRYFRSGVGKGSVSVDVVLSRLVDGSPREIDSWSSSEKIKNGSTESCTASPLGPAFAGDTVRFDYSFKKTPKLNFPDGLIILQSAVGGESDD